MSNSPRAQHGHGSGSGRRTMPATRSPGAEVRAVRRLAHAPERLVSEDEAVAVPRRPAGGARDELLASGPAGDDGDGKDGGRGSPRSATDNRSAARPDRPSGAEAVALAPRGALGPVAVRRLAYRGVALEA